ncbi:MAG TPA: M50 family metallopeptidase [Clostridia bacterium]|nr:M50 family metallopeptidase [Clostridia bacterium]
MGEIPMRIGSIFDVDIKISITLVILVIVAILLGSGTEISIFFFVFLAHETAHVLAAKSLKMKVSEIEILPFGGAVRIESIFELNPMNEIYIALAGPGINIILLLGYSALQNLGIIMIKENDIFAKANLILAGFNLLPALPLDGGRVLRAVLSREMGIKKATNIAAYGGLALSFFLVMSGIYGLYLKIFNPSFFLLSGFLAYSAFKEKRNVSYIFLRDVTYKRDILIKEGTLTSKELVVLYDLPLKSVMKKFVPHRYHYIKVVDHSLRIWGYLDETQIVNGMVDRGVNIPIGRLLKDSSNNLSK